MCYSAVASFAASGVLMAGGAVVIKKSRPAEEQLLYASIPIIFSVHQFLEGLVWLGVDGHVSTTAQSVAMYLYAFFAFAFWPAFISLAMLAYEWPRQKHLLMPVAAVGFLVGAYLLWCFTAYSPLSLQANCGFNGCDSLGYLFTMPYLSGTIDYIYLAAVTAPFFLSGNQRIRYIVGPAFLLSFPIARYLSTIESFPSVWCFIAALISVVIFYSLKREPLIFGGG